MQASSGHPAGAVTSTAECPLCDGPCKHPWYLPEVHATYPFLPPEMVAAMQPTDEQDPDPGAPDTEPQPVRGRRRGGNRMKQPGENTAHGPSEDRAAD